MDNLNKISIVFIHGNSCSSEYFYQQRNSNLLSKYDLHFFDLIGHGKENNSTNESDYSIDSQAKFILEKIKSLGLTNVVLAGHSLGGHVSLRVKSLDEEDIIKGIFAWGTPFFGDSLRFDLALQQNPELTLLFSTEWSEDNVDKIYNLFFDKCLDHREENLLKNILKESRGFSRISLAQCISKGPHFNEIKFIKESGVPILIGIGRQDKILNSDYFDLELSDLNLVKVYGSHSFHIDNAEVFNELLFDFADDLSIYNLGFMPIGKENGNVREY